jgi:hypothetical protein
LIPPPSKRQLNTVIFHPPKTDSWLSSARQHDLRVTMAQALVDIVEIFGGPLVFPAGFLRAPSAEAREGLAHTLLRLSAASGTGLIFGIDVGSTDEWPALAAPAESFVFACEAGRPLLWPAATGSSDEVRWPERVVGLGGMRIGVLLGREVFSPRIRLELPRGQPDVIVLLTHAGPTARWKRAIEQLHSIAPTVVVGESSDGGEPEWACPPTGWVRVQAGGTPSTTLQRYEEASVRDWRSDALI